MLPSLLRRKGTKNDAVHIQSEGRIPRTTVLLLSLLGTTIGVSVFNLITGNQVTYLVAKNNNHYKALTVSYTTQENSKKDFPGLRAIVTGFEHSCTTVIAKLLFNAPCVIGAFETGFLLASSPKYISKVQPWYEWHKHGSSMDSYGLTPEDLLAMEKAPDFQVMFDILRDRSYLFNELIDEEYCEKPYQLIDKTPRYIHKDHFENVLDNTPGVPVIVVQKGFYKLAESWAKRNDTLTRQNYDATFDNVWRMKQKYPHRILIVQEENLMKYPNAVMEDVFHHVGLEWNSEYLEMKGLLRKVSNDSLLEKYVEKYKFRAGKHSFDLAQKNQIIEVNNSN
jgi:hypothetical protein